MLGRSIAEVCLRRLLKGPRSPAWNLATEIGTEILKRQLLAAFEMPDLNAARSYLDSLVFESGVTSKVSISSVVQDDFRGSWYVPEAAASDVMILYLHGGGYSFNPKGLRDLTALISLSANAPAFALDYRLSPEYRFPAQLVDATNSYRWLLSNKIASSNIVVAGDSAGANLTLALLLSLRDSKLPLPALAICLSPATDFETEVLDPPGDSGLDWINPHMAAKWADWFCTPNERGNPLISQLKADLRSLPPIYIQAGGSEILLAGIQAFVDRAKGQGAEIALEIWPEMNHDFQVLGPNVPQSAEAVRRIGEVIDERIRKAHRSTVSKS